MSDQHFQVIREFMLHEAHVIAERTRARLRDLQRRYPFPRPVLEDLEKVGIDLTDEDLRK
jgi:hypothetical protein